MSPARPAPESVSRQNFPEKDAAECAAFKRPAHALDSQIQRLEVCLNNIEPGFEHD